VPNWALSQSRLQVRQACEDAGLEGDFLETCVFDSAATGDTDTFTVSPAEGNGTVLLGLKLAWLCGANDVSAFEWLQVVGTCVAAV